MKLNPDLIGTKSKFGIWFLEFICHLDFDIRISPKEAPWLNQDSSI